MNCNHLKKLMKYILSINVYRMSLEWLETKLSIKTEMAVTTKLSLVSFPRILPTLLLINNDGLTLYTPSCNEVYEVVQIQQGI